MRMLVKMLKPAVAGRLRRRCAVESHLRPHVRLAGDAVQQDAGHEEQETVLHRCTGYRRLRDLRGTIHQHYRFRC